MRNAKNIRYCTKSVFKEGQKIRFDFYITSLKNGHTYHLQDTKQNND